LTEKDTTTKRVVLLSGGLDSAVTAWLAKDHNSELYTMSFLYGQRHRKELECAKALSAKVGALQHKIISNVPLDQIGGSALTDPNIDVPKRSDANCIPVTWVPQRNSLFLAMAFAWAEIIGASEVWIGVNMVDYSGYPDCRLEFLKAMNRALNLASKRYVETGLGISIVAPVIHMRKSEEILIGAKLGVPFDLTWSCYQGGDKACGICDSCQIRLKAFEEAGLKDPIAYQK